MRETQFRRDRVVHIGAVPFAAGVAIHEAVEEVLSDHEQDEPSHFHLANAYCVALADSDAAYAATLGSGRVFADGRPVQWVSSIRRDSARVRQVRGPSLFEQALATGSDREVPTRHYLLGGSEETLASLRRQIEQRFPHAIVCGSWSPPFRSLEENELIEQDRRIIDAQPHVVWVGLGTPKQDYECARITRTTGLPSVAVGAAFDFTAGTINVAPVWMSKFGVEWVYRLFLEPKRLWRRYFFGNPRFVWAVIRPRSRR